MNELQLAIQSILEDFDLQKLKKASHELSEHYRKNRRSDVKPTLTWIRKTIFFEKFAQKLSK